MSTNQHSDVPSSSQTGDIQVKDAHPTAPVLPFKNWPLVPFNDLARLLLRVHTKLSDTQDSPMPVVPDSQPTARCSDQAVKAPIHTQHASHSSPDNIDSPAPVPSSPNPILLDAPLSSTADPGMKMIPCQITSETSSSSGEIGGECLMTGSKRTRGSSSDSKEEPTSKRRCLDAGAVSLKTGIKRLEPIINPSGEHISELTIGTLNSLQ
ncbi:uncharacterized protein EV420DRAFT_1652707 [Desarmillaria tabescens]|uniref:Uncharacterized protein n=1 Tax=Armillaria tabescens TaxID=1929756 RepID=A0AA39J660_ARMTA|nr:uncharacterized protein EV420DRAFT_1652707 [Desarmillaria tabescens]KAK0436077.1 hypothetical protein EV420DRAFT_1652707 [Desarmillaria tabescens]